MKLFRPYGGAWFAEVYAGLNHSDQTAMRKWKVPTAGLWKYTHVKSFGV